MGYWLDKLDAGFILQKVVLQGKMAAEITDLAQQAIKAALEGNWEEATQINETILGEEARDVEAMNRLARAYRETGKVNKARELYKKVLVIDKLNVIAQRGLEKLKARRTTGKGQEEGVGGLAKEFLEEAGKTKVVQLIYPAEQAVLAALDSGDTVKMVAGKHKVCFCDRQGKYLGRLPDDLALRLIKLTMAGNSYEAIVKSVEGKQIKVFLREVARGEKVAQIASFPVGERINYVAFTPPDLVHKEKPDVTALEDEEIFDQEEVKEVGEDELEETGLREEI